MGDNETLKENKSSLNLRFRYLLNLLLCCFYYILLAIHSVPVNKYMKSFHTKKVEFFRQLSNICLIGSYTTFRDYLRKY